MTEDEKTENNYPPLWVCWDRKTGKIVGFDERSKHHLCEWLSHSGYLSQANDDHPGFDILEYRHK